jgi:hypothetical protein
MNMLLNPNNSGACHFPELASLLLQQVLWASALIKTC